MAAGRRVDAERPRPPWREAGGRERCLRHVSGAAAGVSAGDLRCAGGTPLFARARAEPE